MKRKLDWFYVQSGVIPYRIREGRIEVMLITTMRRKRWIIPKGIVEPGLTPEVSAAYEAEEEAGVRGEVSAQPLGSYQREKWGGTCTIQVFTLKVTEVLETWPECTARERRWLSPEEAVKWIDAPDLKEIFRNFANYLYVGRHD